MSAEEEFDALLEDLGEDEPQKKREKVTSKAPVCKNPKYCASGCFGKPKQSDEDIGAQIKASAECFAECCSSEDTPEAEARTPEEEDREDDGEEQESPKSKDEEDLDSFLEEL